jgi:acyl CoA:acetate/3-ketoacid CoA transferase alpha subunit
MKTDMIWCVLASVLVPEGSLRNGIACAGIGLPVWVTAVVILSQDLRLFPSGQQA